MLPQGFLVAEYDSPLSGNQKYLEFEVDLEPKKTHTHTHTLRKLEQVGQAWLP